MHPVEALRWIAQWDLGDPVGLCQEAAPQLRRASWQSGLLVSACRQLVKAAPVGPVVGLAAAALLAIDPETAMEEFLDHLENDPVWQMDLPTTPRALWGRRVEVRTREFDPGGPALVIPAALCGDHALVVGGGLSRRKSQLDEFATVVVVGRSIVVGRATWELLCMQRRGELDVVDLGADSIFIASPGRVARSALSPDVAEVPELIR